ncbi:hypothetical protein ACKWTF_014537 [Chironomus riparius]
MISKSVFCLNSLKIVIKKFSSKKMENLSDFFIQKAKTELNETESRKEQSIKQFYEWLSKHPFINKLDIEPFQVITFLRARKYNMDKVFECFNNFVNFKRCVPQLYDFHSFKELLDIYNKGPILVMNDRDSDGRRIVLLRHKVLEDSKASFINILKLSHLIGASLIDEPETQICGLVMIHDFRNVTFNYTKIIDTNLLCKILTMADSNTIRIKQINFIGFPSFANSLFELAKSFLNYKMKSRLNLLKNIEDLTKVMDVKNLPVEYGGTDNLNDCLKQRRKDVENQAHIAIKFFDSFVIDEKKMKIYENEKSFEAVGSFRKLEID